MACKIIHDLLGGFASIKEYNQIGNSDLFCLCQVLLHRLNTCTIMTPLFIWHTCS